MKRIFILFLIILLNAAYCAVSVGSAEPPRLFDSSVSESFSDIEVVLENMMVRSASDGKGKSNDLVFDIVLRNLSAYHKYDIVAPFDVVMSDEFGNLYRERTDEVFSKPRSDNKSEFSLYPGENVRIPCHFQVPVPAAKELRVQISDQTGQFSRQIDTKTTDIKNWALVTGGPVFANDDLIIVYPRDKKIFAPGDKVFLKVDFSASVGRPQNIHVVLPNYVLTDDQANGQYELQIPSDMVDGDYEVVVLAEWGDSPDSHIISKTLFLQIKG